MRVDVSIGKTGEVHGIESLEVVERLLPFLFTPARMQNLCNNSTKYPCFRSGIRIGSGFNQVNGSGFNQVNGSGSRRAKMTHKNRKKLGNFMF
jgi:hypothetical protein